MELGQSKALQAPLKRFRFQLAGLLTLGALVHGALLAQQWWGGAPLARVPLVDAQVYWDWAGRIAEGHWQGESPFFSAPLYPYCLGFLRQCGGGLLAVYCVQVLMHLATAYGLAQLGRARFDDRIGLMAAGVWLGLLGPAYANCRVLAGPLQALLVTLSLMALTAYQDRPRPSTALRAGLAIGLTCLAWPPAMGAAVLLMPWVVWGVKTHKRNAALLACAAVLSIAPATLHNYNASGEFIPITAHGGITFYHGNNPSADGTFSPYGVSGDKRVHERDAYDQALAASGQDGAIGWREVSSYFSGLGMAWLMEHPADAVGLLARKAWMFVSSSVHGEMYIPALEVADGSALGLGWLPLRVRFIVWPALVAAGLLLWARPRQHWPEAVFALLALGVCVAFFYSPRYRLPAVPVYCLLAAWGVTQLPRAVRGSRAGMALLSAFGLALVTGALNDLAGFDQAEKHAAEYELRVGRAYLQLGEDELGRARIESARELGWVQADLELAAMDLAVDPGAALKQLESMARERPTDGAAQRMFGLALAQTGQFDLALERFRAAIALDGNDVDAEMGAGGCWVQLGQPVKALAHFERAQQLDGQADDLEYNRGVALELLDQTDAARHAYEAELDRNPEHLSARGALVSLLQRSGEHALAVRHARITLKSQPGHVGARLVLAWLLATSSDSSVWDGDEAVEMAQGLVDELGQSDGGLLDTLAAAHARAGHWAEACQVGERALAASQGADASMLEEVRGRLELYRSRQAFQGQQ